jgi:hypothetical protein
MDGTAVQQIERLSKENMLVELDGLTFSPLPLKPVFHEPTPKPLEMHTLSGLVEYVRTNIDSLMPKQTLILVDNPDTVELVSLIDGKDRHRDRYAIVKLDSNLKEFPFGKYQDVESFVVGLRSMFEPTPDLEKLVMYVSKVRGGKSFSLDDDGVSQTTSVAVGVSGALTKKETAPAIVRLRPYRTFRDIEQTESEFLFRMKLVDTEDNIVGACLYEADGGRWRHFASQSIKKFLEEALPGMTVIA